MTFSPVPCLLAAAAALAPLLLAAAPAPAPVEIRVERNGRAISPDLFGVFFEDINYAADGGLYAELVQNRSFEYQATEQITWNSVTAWEFTERGGGKGRWTVDAGDPVHPNNPHYVAVHASKPGTGVGIVNSGFDGIPVRAGESYNLSLFARQLYLGDRWKQDTPEALAKRDGEPGAILVRIEGSGGEVIGEAPLPMPGKDWTRLAATITARTSDPRARLAVLATYQGGLALDVISLFPAKTFHNRANGLRPDLAQAIADLKPKFVRFPGGCLVHGNGLGNMYRWKNTIGPVEQRREQANLWGYHQTAGLGYFEFFQFCEDIGAKPLPVLPAAVCCQNSAQMGSGTGQKGLPLAEIPSYIQEVFDLIEYANGPATSVWGAQRAAAGHPAPFNLQYLAIGNEDAQTPVFRERFRPILNALRTRYPRITVIGTVGPFASGADFDQGWKFAKETKTPVVDEHYYMEPEWFLSNLRRYDSYDRNRSKVYLGEYASLGNTLFNAVAEAAYLTAIERNGDVVRLASYAPLLAREGHTQWKTDLIFFSDSQVCLTPNYYVQQLFSTNQGDTYLPTTVSSQDVAASCVRDSRSGDIILKLVNPSAAAVSSKVNLSDLGEVGREATRTVLTGACDARNTLSAPRTVAPETSPLSAGASFTCDLPACSLTVIRLKARS